MANLNVQAMTCTISLHDINAWDDIRTFLQFCFGKIHRKHHEIMRSVSFQWPLDSHIETLVSRSSGLFIYASVMLNFIDSKGKHPVTQLEIALQIPGSPEESPLEALHQLYKKILLKSSYIRLMRSVVETIILLLDPLPLTEVERLLRLKNEEGWLTLAGLHSIFIVPNKPGTSVQIFYVLLYEFLMSAQCPYKYSINCQAHHTQIAELCLRMMMKSLK